jgi:hypothetical protein
LICASSPLLFQAPVMMMADHLIQYPGDRCAKRPTDLSPLDHGAGAAC